MFEIGWLQKLAIIALAAVCLITAIWRFANPPLSPKLEQRLRSGWQQFDIGEIGMARERFQGVLAMLPEHEEARFGKQLIDTLGYPSLKRPRDKALADIKPLIAAHSDSPYPLIIAAKIALDLQEYELALRYLDGGISLNPQLPALWTLKGFAYQKDRQPMPAVKAYRHALHLHSGYDRWLTPMLAKLEWTSGRLDRAESEYAGLLERYPGLTSERFNLARVRLLNKRLKHAEQDFKQLREIVTSTSTRPSRRNLPWRAAEMDDVMLRTDAEKLTYVSMILSVIQRLLDQGQSAVIRVADGPGLDCARTLVRIDVSKLRAMSADFEVWLPAPKERTLESGCSP